MGVILTKQTAAEAEGGVVLTKQNIIAITIRGRKKNQLATSKAQEAL